MPIEMTNCVPWKNRFVNIALICYEKPSDFCHGHLVSDWLKENGFNFEDFIQEYYRTVIESVCNVISTFKEGKNE